MKFRGVFSYLCFDSTNTRDWHGRQVQCFTQGLILSLICAVPCVSWADCDTLLAKGVWDTQTNMTATQTSSSFLNWFCSRDYGSSQSARDEAIKVGFVYEDLPIEVGAYNRNSDWKTYYAELCHTESGSYTHADQTYLAISKASPIILDAYLACVNRPGLQASYRLSPDPKYIILDVSYLGLHPNDNTSTPTIAWTPSNGAVCAQQGTPYSVGTPLSIVGRRYLSCTRTNTKQSLWFTVEDKNLLFNPSAIFIPALNPPPVPVCPGVLPSAVKNEGQYVATLSLENKECERTVQVKGTHYTIDGHGEHAAVVEVRYSLANSPEQQLCMKTTGNNHDSGSTIACSNTLTLKPFQKVTIRAMDHDSPGQTSYSTVLEVAYQ